MTEADLKREAELYARSIQPTMALKYQHGQMIGYFSHERLVEAWLAGRQSTAAEHSPSKEKP